ncbi:hypothetical protein [Sinomonas sp. B1-1]|uniref:hypothetical protein n=1 Tax=Sinomonas sp. B1-1 TaxID=3141454 RepID=UPI003D2D41A8
MNTVTPENPDESQKDAERGPGGYGVPTPEQEMGQGAGEPQGGGQQGGGQQGAGQQAGDQQAGDEPTSGSGQRADADELAGEQRDPVTGEDLKPGGAESSA